MEVCRLLVCICGLVLSCCYNLAWAKHYSLFELDYDADWYEIAPESKNSASYNVVSLFNDSRQTMVVIYTREENRPLSAQELQERAEGVIANLKKGGFLMTKHWFSPDREFFICRGRLDGIKTQLRIYQIESLVFIVMIAGNDIEAGSELAGEIETFY